MGAGQVDGGSTAYQMGQGVGDGAATLSGVAETGIGLGGEGVGAALDATGVGAVVGVPINIASAGLIAHGATTSVVGGANLGKDAVNAFSDNKGSGTQASKETGSYTNTHESGKTYDGKGGKARSQDSGRQIEKQTGDKHTATEWKPAENDREAFKDESRRLDSHGGADSSANHNKIESPGKKYREQDGSK
jgi:hypothetical protein